MQADMSGFIDSLMSFNFRWGVRTVWARYRPNLSFGSRTAALTVRKMLIVKLLGFEFCAILIQIVCLLKADPMSFIFFNSFFFFFPYFEKYNLETGG